MSRDWFRCTRYGHAQHADRNAASVILGPKDADVRSLTSDIPENARSGSACGVKDTALEQSDAALSEKREPRPAMAWNQTRTCGARSLALQGGV